MRSKMRKEEEEGGGGETGHYEDREEIGGDKKE